MENIHLWVYMDLLDLIDLEVDKKGEKNNDRTINDQIRNGVTKPSSKHIGQIHSEIS